MTDSDLGKLLRDTRQALGMSLRDMERKTDKALRSGYLSQLERGLIRHPTPKTLGVLADLYGLGYSELLARAGHRVPSEGERGSSPGLIAGLPVRALEELDEQEQEELRQFVAFLKQRRSTEGDAKGPGLERRT